MDYRTGKAVLKLLHKINRDMKKTVVVITHNAAIAAMAQKVIKLKSGELESITHNDKPLPADEIEW